MRKHLTLLAGAAAVTALVLAPALAQSGQSGQTTGGQKSGTTQQQPDQSKTKRGSQGQTSGADRTGSIDQTRGSTATSNFIMKAAQGGLAEVELGRLATQKASHDAVKQFGQTMVDDHTRANEELKKIATAKNVNLPTTVDAKHKATVDRLSKLSGAEFDRAYMTEMVREHRQDVADFQREADRGTDPEVKAFAAKTAPVLKQHLERAEAIHAQVGGAAQGKTKTESRKSEK